MKHAKRIPKGPSCFMRGGLACPHGQTSDERGAFYTCGVCSRYLWEGKPRIVGMYRKLSECAAEMDEAQDEATEQKENEEP